MARVQGEGEDGWESQSDAGSAHSAYSQRRRRGGVEGGAAASAPVVKTVAKLRPDKPLVVAASTNIADLAQAMVERRAAAVSLEPASVIGLDFHMEECSAEASMFPTLPSRGLPVRSPVAAGRELPSS